MADDDDDARRGLFFDASTSSGDNGRPATSSRSQSPERAPRDALDASLVRWREKEREFFFHSHHQLIVDRPTSTF